MNSILHFVTEAINERRKLLAVLIDPDTIADPPLLTRTVQNACMAKADLLLVGGSLLHTDAYAQCVKQVSELSDRPVVLFPGSPAQVSPDADAILFLSLISGRNPEFLIGHHVTAAPVVRSMGLEAIPTGYMLIDGGKETTAHYVSQTQPIPFDKDEIAAATAQAGELLGMKFLYLDTGSGANKHVSLSMIDAVKEASALPVIIGGGIRTKEQAQAICRAGADMIVIGTAFEEDPEAIFVMSDAVHACSAIQRNSN